MIKPANHNNRSLLVKTIHELGVEPWLGRADWEAVRKELDGTNHGVRGWYRRLCDWLVSNGHTIQEYAEQETGHPYTTTPFPDYEESPYVYELIAEDDEPGGEEGDGHYEAEFDVPTSFEEFVALASLDLEQWDVANARSTYWDGKWGWRVQLAPKKGIEALDFEALVDRLSVAAPPYEVERYDHNLHNPCLLVPTIYDAHLEKLFTDGSGIRETVAAYDHVAAKIVSRAVGSEFHFGQVLLVAGQDFGHIDNGQGETTAGTRVDTSVGRKAGIDQRIELLIRTVERFLTLAPVHVVLVPGNHDRDDTYWTGKLLQAWFRNNNRVRVDNGHSSRKFYRWGKSLFMMTHGDQEKREDLPNIMAAEAPPAMWAASTHREVFNGHLHTMRRAYQPLTEEKGIIIRWFSSLSNPDDWHALKGFLGNNRGGFGLVYDKEERLVDEFPVLL